jgi:hypothetical protein
MCGPLVFFGIPYMPIRTHVSVYNLHTYVSMLTHLHIPICTCTRTDAYTQEIARGGVSGWGLHLIVSMSVQNSVVSKLLSVPRCLCTLVRGSINNNHNKNKIIMIMYATYIIVILVTIIRTRLLALASLSTLHKLCRISAISCLLAMYRD